MLKYNCYSGRDLNSNLWVVILAWKTHRCLRNLTYNDFRDLKTDRPFMWAKLLIKAHLSMMAPDRKGLTNHKPSSTHLSAIQTLRTTALHFLKQLMSHTWTMWLIHTGPIKSRKSKWLQDLSARNWYDLSNIQTEIPYGCDDWQFQKLFSECQSHYIMLWELKEEAKHCDTWHPFMSHGGQLGGCVCHVQNTVEAPRIPSLQCRNSE